MTRQWVFCLTNGPDMEGNELADYFAMLTRTMLLTRDNRFLLTNSVEGLGFDGFVVNPRDKFAHTDNPNHRGINFTEPRESTMH